jgi:hypothetical protein
MRAATAHWQLGIAAGCTTRLLALKQKILTGHVTGTSVIHMLTGVYTGKEYQLQSVNVMLNVRYSAVLRIRIRMDPHHLAGSGS